MKLSVCTTGKTPSVLKGTYRFQNIICSHPDDIQGRPSYFRMLNSRVQITTAQLIYCRKVQLTDCLLSRPFTDWKHLSHRDRTGNKNGATEVQQPLSSVPRSLQTVAESRREAPQWETWSQRHVVSTKFKISSYFSLNCTFVQFKHWRVLSVLLHMKHEFVSL